MTSATAAVVPTSEPMPPVLRLREGLWSVPVPLPSASLRYVLVYVFETDAGAYLVDAGWSTPDAYESLESGLADAGFVMTDVRGVLVTHAHHDHYGLAGRIREASGAWIALHPAEARHVHERLESPERVWDRIGAVLRTTGAPPEVLAEVHGGAVPAWLTADTVRPDMLLEDGDRPDVPGWDLTAIWTPGHTPGHLCFWEPRNRVLLTGDHVLPRITPNIPSAPDPDSDPLGDFLASVDKLEPYDCEEVLPAHEHQFVGLQDRLQELRAHHADRCDEAVRAVVDGCTTAWEVAQRMAWSRAWDEIDGNMRRAAVAEAHAHLRALARRRVLREVVGEPTRWCLRDPS